VGIDLGTTNSAISYIDTNHGQNAKIKRFKIPQLIRKGELGSVSVLPSFLYIPGEYELTSDEISQPWEKANDNFAGVFARDYGSKVPSRLISSAKSWLCHDKTDRNAKLLPWGAKTGVKKLSPVEATAEYLLHIRKTWNLDKKQDDNLYLENQFLTITIPASFDEVARELTLKACEMAGLSNVILLEEPLAAFYSWLTEREKNWDNNVSEKELILVCDVGGGTTDFTLIALRDIDGSPRFDRIAVGNHLILGGDNIDLAMARLAESKIKSKKNIMSGDRWKTLCHLVRAAKEKLLEGLSESERITITGKGSKLIGDTISTRLDKTEVENIIINGFFRPVAMNDLEIDKNLKKGITEFGLPYESDPVITRHLGRFLMDHQDDVKKILGKDLPIPDHVLFNGGSLKPEIVQNAVINSIAAMFKLDQNSIPNILENPCPDTAVSIGAAYYGKVKLGLGVKVGSGSPRSYYLGIETKEGKKGALCLIERGLAEGSKIVLPEEYSFMVKTNQPVSFELFSSSFRANDKCGDFINHIDDSFSKLPPLQTMIKFGKLNEEKEITIDLNANFTEAGTLSIWCESKESQHRWDLSFDLRSISNINHKMRINSMETFDEKLIHNCSELLSHAFSNNDKEVISIVKKISKTIEIQKNRWPLMFIRKLSDILLENKIWRKKSPVHEARWLNLSGFCLRPGTGAPLDEERMKKVWEIYKEGLSFPNEIQNKNEWWIFLRRVGAGLKPGYQRQIAQDLSSILKQNKISEKEKAELWMMIGNFENLHSNDKVRFGNILKNSLNPNKFESKMILSLGRIGARELLYGNIEKVVPKETIAKWIPFFMTKKWSTSKEVLYAISQMGRLTGDRTRDIDEDLKKEAIEFLESNGDQNGAELLKKVVQIKSDEEKQIFGEALPAGIILHHK